MIAVETKLKLARVMLDELETIGERPPCNPMRVMQHARHLWVKVQETNLLPPQFTYEMFVLILNKKAIEAMSNV